MAAVVKNEKLWVKEKNEKVKRRKIILKDGEKGPKNAYFWVKNSKNVRGGGGGEKKNPKFEKKNPK